MIIKFATMLEAVEFSETIFETKYVFTPTNLDFIFPKR